MEILKSVQEIQQKVKSISRDNRTTGFVPTMGALHAGHVSLVKKSIQECDITIVSIFVNPKQFNSQSDFDNYPVNIEKDIEILEKCGCDIVFVPNADDLYRNYAGYKLNFKGLDRIYEGEFRPGHFQGVVDVVYRLFDLIKPQKSYFGQKDFQQLAIINLLVVEAKLDIEIIGCPIVREPNGLAMSSRNKRLNSKEFKKAAQIYEQIVNISKKIKIGDNTKKYSDEFVVAMKKIENFKPEYCIFCDNKTLKEIKTIQGNSHIAMCVAVWCSEVRLIDNIILDF